MTRQACERLELDDQELLLYSTPCIPRHPRIIADSDSLRSTACRRGYVGRWKVAGARLYLTAIDGRYRVLGPRPIFADWVSAKLLVDDPENAAGSLLLEVRGGRVVGLRALDRRPEAHRRRLLTLQVYLMLLLLLVPPAVMIVAMFAARSSPL